MLGVCFFALLVFFPTVLPAQFEFTQGQILATPGTPSQTLYADRGGLFKSTDLGVRWTPLYMIEPGLAQPKAIRMVIDPISETNLYVASTAAAGMVWKSIDAGATWKLASAGLPTSGADPVYFAWNETNRSLYLAAQGKLYKSTDGAATWTLQGTLPGANRAFDICGSTPSRMYYGEGVAVYRSDDEGRTWNAVASLFPPSVAAPNSTTIGVVGVDHANPNLVIVSMGGGDTSRLGIFRNVNGGQGSFERVWLGYIVRFFGGPLGPYYGNSGTGGIVRSTNGGTVWVDIPGQFASINAVDPKNRAILYTGGMGRSTDQGNTTTTLIGTATPTLSKESAPIVAQVELGTDGVVPLTVAAVENSNWVFPFTASTSGEPWLTLDAVSGNTPRTLNVRFSPTGLALGTYTATITLSAPATLNKTVDLPVRMTVVARDAGRPNYTVSTIAGRGDNVLLPSHLVVDSGNNLFIGESSRRVWRLALSPLGRPEVFAGNGESGGAGDGGPAASAQLSTISGLALGTGNTLYISESANRTVRRVSGGTITLIADRNTPVRGGLSTTFFGASGLALDATGRLLLTTTTSLLRLPPNATSFDTVPVNVSPGLQSGSGVVVDREGNIYIGSSSQNKVYRISAQGNSSVFAGTGTAGYSGDGGPATAAMLDSPTGLAVDQEGNLYICDRDNNRLRLVTRDGVIRTIAGTGGNGNSGDGGPAVNADLFRPNSVAVDAAGNVYVATSGVVRMLTRQGGSGPTVAAAVNAASGSAKVSPGGLVSIYGQNLAGETLVTSAASWPSTLAGTSVTVNGRAAPIWFVSAGQINAQVPVETPVGTAQVAVSVAGATAGATVQVVPAAPGLLACPSCGVDHGLAVNPDGSLNTPSKPARPAETIVVYLAGVGAVAATVSTGQPSPSSPLPAATLPHSITLGGRPANYVYLGLTPTFVALAQANVTIPDLPAGEHRLVITVNGEASNALNISVGP